MEEKIELIHRQISYDIVIPENVNMKINHVCSKLPTLEWSGVLFFDYSGSFKEKNLVITCRDFVLMDIGSGTGTSFDINADVIAYAVENDLVDCKQGLIHSHNQMAK